MKKLIRSVLNSFGYSLHRIDDAESRYLEFAQGHGFLHGLVLLELMRKRESKEAFKIIQVGANDGVTVDPVFPIAERFSDETELLLIEPQDNAFEKLNENYKFHPRKKMCNMAVGEGGEIALYRIRPDLQSHYKGIIGSGVTSGNKEYVENKANMLLPKCVIRQEKKCGGLLVEPITIKSYKLIEIILKHQFGEGVDWLQIDTEGFDDVVIYNSSIEVIRPKIISFESCHLNDIQLDRLWEYLSSFGYYRFIASQNDECAVLLGLD